MNLNCTITECYKIYFAIIMKKLHLIISICLFLLFCTVSAYAQKSQKPVPVKLPFAFSGRDRGELMENTPVLFNSRLLLVANYRPSGGPDAKDKEKGIISFDTAKGQEYKLTF